MSDQWTELTEESIIGGILGTTTNHNRAIATSAKLVIVTPDFALAGEWSELTEDPS